MALHYIHYTFTLLHYNNYFTLVIHYIFTYIEVIYEFNIRINYRNIYSYVGSHIISLIVIIHY